MINHRQIAHDYVEANKPVYDRPAIGPTWMAVVLQLLVMATTPALLVACWAVGHYGHAWWLAASCLICLILCERGNGGFFVGWYPSQIKSFWRTWHGKADSSR
jgi:hypothetical protein